MINTTVLIVLGLVAGAALVTVIARSKRSSLSAVDNSEEVVSEPHSNVVPMRSPTEQGSIYIRNAHIPRDEDFKTVESDSVSSNPTHPGVILNVQVIQARGLDVDQVAKYLNVTPRYLKRVLAGKMPMNPMLAQRIENTLSYPADVLVNLQKAYDEVEDARRKAEKAENVG